MRRFIPKEGSKLAEEQAEIERRVAEEASQRSNNHENQASGKESDEGDNEPEGGRSVEGNQTVNQATRTPPHERGAHGVVDYSIESRDIAGDRHMTRDT